MKGAGIKKTIPSLFFVSLLFSETFTTSDPPMIYIYHFVSYDSTTIISTNTNTEEKKSRTWLRLPFTKPKDVDTKNESLIIKPVDPKLLSTMVTTAVGKFPQIKIAGESIQSRIQSDNVIELIKSYDYPKQTDFVIIGEINTLTEAGQYEIDLKTIDVSRQDIIYSESFSIKFTDEESLRDKIENKISALVKKLLEPFTGYVWVKVDSTSKDKFRWDLAAIRPIETMVGGEVVQTNDKDFQQYYIYDLSYGESFFEDNGSIKKTHSNYPYIETAKRYFAIRNLYQKPIKEYKREYGEKIPLQIIRTISNDIYPFLEGKYKFRAYLHDNLDYFETTLYVKPGKLNDVFIKLTPEPPKPKPPTPIGNIVINNFQDEIGILLEEIIIDSTDEINPDTSKIKVFEGKKSKEELTFNGFRRKNNKGESPFMMVDSHKIYLFQEYYEKSMKSSLSDNEKDGLKKLFSKSDTLLNKGKKLEKITYKIDDVKYSFPADSRNTDIKITESGNSLLVENIFIGTYMLNYYALATESFTGKQYIIKFNEKDTLKVEKRGDKASVNLKTIPKRSEVEGKELVIYLSPFPSENEIYELYDEDNELFSKIENAGEVHILGIPTDFSGHYKVERSGFLSSTVEVIKKQNKTYAMADLTKVAPKSRGQSTGVLSLLDSEKQKGTDLDENSAQNLAMFFKEEDFQTTVSEQPRWATETQERSMRKKKKDRKKKDMENKAKFSPSDKKEFGRTLSSKTVGISLGFPGVWNGEINGTFNDWIIGFSLGLSDIVTASEWMVGLNYGPDNSGDYNGRFIYLLLGNQSWSNEKEEYDYWGFVNRRPLSKYLFLDGGFVFGNEEVHEGIQLYIKMAAQYEF